MLIKNCKIIYIDKIEKGSVLIEDGKIKKINPSHYEGEVFDAKGLYLSPGFIDIHIHGAGGHDTMEGTYVALNNISKTIMERGTTSFLPTTMTVSIEEINKAVRAIKELKDNGAEGANIIGAHLEGPFINLESVGAQNPQYVLKPSVEGYKKIVKDCEDVIVSVTLAPELEGSKELIHYLKEKNIICSVGHTKAKYEEVKEAVNYGISHSTHLYNAMTGFNHRDPGCVGAVFDSDITTELIADGIHIVYPVLEQTFKIKGTDNIILVSDSMMACCMEDGNYYLGGLDVIVSQGVARLKNGALAGSVLTLDKAVKNVYKNCNIPLYEVIKMVTYNPAKYCGINGYKGIIKEGYDADLVLFDNDINIERVFINNNLYN